MRAGRTWPLAAAVFVVLALAAPAAAHENELGSSWLTEDHPGWYWPSTSSQTGELRDGRQRRADQAAQHVPQLRPCVLGPARLRRSLRGLPDHRRGQPAQAEAARRLRLPGLAARRLGLGRPAVRLGRDPAVQPGVRLDGPAVRTPGFEGIRIFDVSNPRSPLADRRRADRLRLAHAHAGPRPAPPPRAALRRLVHGRPSSRRRATATSASASTRTASRCTTRSPSSRCRCATRRTASVVSEPRFPQKEYRGGLVRLP